MPWLWLFWWYGLDKFCGLLRMSLLELRVLFSKLSVLWLRLLGYQWFDEWFIWWSDHDRHWINRCLMKHIILCDLYVSLASPKISNHPTIVSFVVIYSRLHVLVVITNIIENICIVPSADLPHKSHLYDNIWWIDVTVVLCVNRCDVIRIVAFVLIVV